MKRISYILSTILLSSTLIYATTNESELIFIPNLNCDQLSVPNNSNESGIPYFNFSGCPTPTPSPTPTPTPTPTPEEEYYYYPPTTTQPEPEPTTEPQIEREPIVVVDEHQDGENVNEQNVYIDELATNTQIDTYKDFNKNEDGTNSATVELKGENGEIIETNIKTNLPKESITITSVDGGVETKANINNEDGSQTETTSKVNTNGTMVNKIKVTDKDGKETTTKISSTKVGTNVEINEDGSFTTSYKDNHGLEVKAVASTNGGVYHEVDTTNENGEIVRTIAKSNVKGSQVVIKEDGTIQTSAHSTGKILNRDGSESSVEITVVVEGKSDGKATHILQVKDENGEVIITKAESELDGAETIISEDGKVETKVQNGDSELKVEASADGKATHSITLKNENGNEVKTEATSEMRGAKTTIKESGEVETSAIVENGISTVDYKVVAKPDGEANHQVGVENRLTGQRVVSEASSKIKGAKTTIKESGKVQTEATKEIDGIIVKAFVDTDENGESFTYFKRFTLFGFELEEQDTVKNGQFEAGNKSIIKEENGKLKLDVTTKVTKEILF